MSSTGIVIAAAQITPVGHDIQANVERHVRVIEQAARQGVDFLVFPELSLTGYERKTASQNALLPMTLAWCRCVRLLLRQAYQSWQACR